MHESRVEAALGAASVRELRDLKWDLSPIGDAVLAVLHGVVDGIEVGADRRWLASEATHTSWLLGRGDTCDVRFRARAVSRRHALLVRRGRCWSLVDLAATNATTVTCTKNSAFADSPSATAPG